MASSQDIRQPGKPAPSFRHEQVLWINEPGNPHIRPLDRSALWVGLVHTLRVPQQIDRTVDASEIVESSPLEWHRRSTRGSTVVADRIDFVPETRITVTIEEGPFAGSQSEIHIEAPRPDALLVRIVHEVRGPTVSLTPEEQSARRAAYDSMNVERISCARNVAARTHRPGNA